MSDPEFEALLDRMEAEMESEEDDTPVERHIWESERTVEFGCDKYQFCCSKCATKLTVGAGQSIASAMEEQKVLPDCAEMLVSAVGDF